MSMILIFAGLLGIIICVILIIVFNVKKKPIKSSLIVLGVSIAFLLIGLTATLIASTAEILKPTTTNNASQPSTITQATAPAPAYDTTQPGATTQATPPASTYSTTQPETVTAATQPESADEND